MIYIKDRVDSINNKINNKTILISNICINGQLVKNKRDHVKCKDKDYKESAKQTTQRKKADISIIKTLFKKLDTVFAKLETENIQTLEGIEQIVGKVNRLPKQPELDD